ncbi:uncharacterized protein LOC130636668 isoform X2 [Hydractinia symbiolongicarpus]|uniref:uncharacterized protein LOC130636668 isoform X2 n=1 Tax=Hydractinia symbiolongicarpus TaxID=13093 RepID=UPI00254CE123|nr:uncharacterized protein LOC130636668 isoform X2 [Hydractinia symbiolongicarpus]
MEALMNQFWNSTNPSSLSESRYLWTDAFAVCNYIALYTKYSNKIFLHKALELVDSVHFVLGRYSLQESRKGWISGLTEDDGKLNPTQNGLRIGKKLLERSEHDAYDEDLEWDRDGQYFHYLTKWMHALCVVGNTTGDVKYKDWAVKLAQVVHDKFVHSVGKRKRLYWKMSVNLSRPLIQSMGHHDPLDGLITYQQIQSTLSDDAKTVLSRQIAEMLGICEGRDWTTTDPLGLGGLLCDAYRVHTLLGRDDVALDTKLLETLLQCACKGLEAYIRATEASTISTCISRAWFSNWFASNTENVTK